MDRRITSTLAAVALVLGIASGAIASAEQWAAWNQSTASGFGSETEVIEQRVMAFTVRQTTMTDDIGDARALPEGSLASGEDPPLESISL